MSERSTRLAVIAFVLSTIALAAAIGLAFWNVDLGSEVTKIRRETVQTPCIAHALRDKRCVHQARRIVASCFADKRCRRIIESERTRLRPQKGGGASSTGSPPSSKPGPSAGGPPPSPSPQPAPKAPAPTAPPPSPPGPPPGKGPPQPPAACSKHPDLPPC